MIAQIRGRFDAAEKAIRKALSSREKALGPYDPGLSRCLQRLATILEFQGRYNDAEVAILKALDGQKHLIDTGHRLTLQIMQRLGFVQRAQGKYGDFEKTARQYLDAQNAAYGPKHIDTREAIYTYASALAANNKIAEAEKLFLSLEEIIIRELPFDEKHQYNFYVQHSLGNINVDKGDYATAVKHYEVAYIGIQHTYKDHMKQYGYESTLATALLRADPINNLDRAFTLQQEACSGLERTLASNHPVTLSAIIRLSEVYVVKRDYVQALKLAKRAVNGREKVLNSGHPDIAIARSWLAEVEAKAKADTGAPKTSAPAALGASNKTQKKRRSFMGLRKLMSGSNISMEITGHEIALDATSVNVTNKMLEKTDSQDSVSSEKKRRQSLGLGLTKVTSPDSEDKGKGLFREADSGSDDDNEDRLDYEKSAAYTTHPAPRKTYPPARRAPPPIPANIPTRAMNVQIDNVPAQTLFRQRSDAMAKAINDYHKEKRDLRTRNKISATQSWPKEEKSIDTEQSTSQIRRKPITSRTSSYPLGNQELDSANRVEAPADVPVNPAARLAGPGWDDDQPFIQ